MSLSLHTLLLVALALAVRTVPQGAALEPGRTGGIVLVRHHQQQTEYFSEAESTTNATSETSGESPSPRAALPEAAELPAELSGMLPSPPTSTLAGSDMAAALPDAGELTENLRMSRRSGGYEAETGVFGVRGKGSKFVYVFDRSGSMDGFQGRPLQAAKQELLASLQALGATHQFQIIFYNERPQVFNPDRPAKPRMVFADEQAKRLAAQFIGSVVADGGTHHLEALELALNMQPDVIFFLTDAAEPQLSPAELESIRRRNLRVGATIHAIEFGPSAYDGSINFLVRLAQQNNGQHAYVDVTRLPRTP